MITGTTLNELAAEAHKNAVEHGFYDGVETMDDEALELLQARLFALMHCELSEAIQEERKTGHLYGYDCPMGAHRMFCEYATEDCGYKGKPRCKGLHILGKPPEGCAVELADFVIRLLDWCGWQDVRLVGTVEWAMTRYKHLPRLVNALHEMLCGFVEKIDLASRAIGADDEPTTCVLVVAMISIVEAWFIDRGLSLTDIMREKMEWNTGRPRLHGKLY